MRPIGRPVQRYTVFSKNKFNLPIGLEIWEFSKGNYYSTTTLTRDGRYEIRLHEEIFDFNNIHDALTLMED